MNLIWIIIVHVYMYTTNSRVCTGSRHKFNIQSHAISSLPPLSPDLSILSSPYVLLSLMTLVVPHASNTAAILPKQRRAGQKK